MTRKKKKGSLAGRYFRSVAGVVLASMLLLASVFFTLASRYFYAENMRNLSGAISCLTRVMQETGKVTEDEQLRRSVVTRSADLAGEITGTTIVVCSQQGDILYCTGEQILSGKALTEKQLRALMQTGEDTENGLPGMRNLTDLDGLLPEISYVQCSLYRGEIGNYYLMALRQAGWFRTYTSELGVAFLWASGLMLLVSGLFSLVAAKRISAPLAQISRAADRFGKGDFTARVSVAQSEQNEIGQLAQNFNTMAASLEAIDRSRQSFMGNIAHELRTPMTSIKGFIDGMLDGVIPVDQYPRYLTLVSEEVARLTRLIQSMLDITKLEAGEYRINAKNYDLWQTVGAVMMNSEQRLVDKCIGVGGYDPQRTIVYADPDIIYQVVYNIVDNAIKFTPQGGRIDLDVTTGKGRVYLSVQNTGEGVPADQLPLLFERFYKGDSSRGLNASGSGLGMHISKVLMGVSGGSIRAESDSASWTRFVIELPGGRPELPPRRKDRGISALSRLRTKHRPEPTETAEKL